MKQILRLLKLVPGGFPRDAQRHHYECSVHSVPEFQVFSPAVEAGPSPRSPMLQPCWIFAVGEVVVVVK